FSTFEVDLHTGELRQRGQKVKLQEQPLHVLAALLERPGELVTREDLQKKLWPADTYVDFDHSLNAAIRRLRDALGDSAENPTFVETVARRGYRFLAPVTAHGNGVSAAAPPTLRPVPAPNPEPRSHTWWWVTAAAAAVILVLVGLRLGLSLGQHPFAIQ